jgi:parallel beta-helix repeat protein
MWKSLFRRALLGSVAIVGVLALGAVPANAAHVGCGATITQSTVLDSDLTDCSQDGLVIGADGITLDLDGHTIDGQGGFSGVSNDGSYDGITIKDGRIKQFEFAVDMYEANDVTVSGLFASETISHAVLFVRSNSCVLRGSISYRTGAGLVNPLESTNCLIEHNASFSTGENRAEAIFLFKAVNATVRWNWVSGAYRGIHLGSASNNVITNNFLWGNVRGIEVFDSTDSHLLWNVVTNSQESGIHIWNDGVLGTEIFGTRIIGNVARHNGDDGIHVDDKDTFIARNRANRNADLGIQAVPGVTDGGGNTARGNGNAAQCTNVAC